MRCRDHYGYDLTCSPEAASAYNRGVEGLLRLHGGAEQGVATALALDPTFSTAVPPSPSPA